MGKTILSILGVASLLWIGYVCINLSSLESRLAPDSVFGKNDSTIVIIHKPLEPDYTHQDFQFLAKNAFYAGLLTHTERIQHFYFSSSREIVLLERSKPWTNELIDRYFAGMSITTTAKSAKAFRLSNGWEGLFNKEYLLLTKTGTFSPRESGIDWKYIDRKSTATCISSEKGTYSIQNVYRSSPVELVYISQHSSEQPVVVDDQDIFQDVIPSGFSAFTFYEKNYLRSLGDKHAPVFDWMEKGAVIVRYNQRECLITDCIPGQDPIAVLGNQLNENAISADKKKAHAENISLPESLANYDNWYLEMFNGRVFIAENEQTINEVIGAYETGKTLSQDQQKRLNYFAKSPKRVSYRHIDPGSSRLISMSLLKGSQHTVVLHLPQTEKETATTGQRPAEAANESTVRIDGGMAQLVPVQGSDFLYVLSKSNLLYGIADGKEKWKILLPAAVIGEMRLATSGDDLIVTTATNIHRIMRTGAERNGTPVKLNKVPVTEAVHYSWKNAAYYAVADAENLTVYTESGTTKSSIKLPFTPGNTPFVVWSNSGDLTATFSGREKGFNLSIDRKRTINEFPLPNNPFTVVKTAKGACLIGIRQGKIIRINHRGNVTELTKNGYTSVLRILHDGTQPLIIARGNQNVVWLTTEGQISGSIRPAFNDVSSAHIQTDRSGKTVVVLLDGIANKNYIYNANGQQFSPELYDGNGMSVLHKQADGKLRIISQSNGYLVRYLLDH